METQNKVVCIPTDKKQQLIDLTDMLHETVTASGFRNGVAGIYSQHTTASLIVGERQAALIDDVHGCAHPNSFTGSPSRHALLQFFKPIEHDLNLQGLR